MSRLILLLLSRATPQADREWVIGDTLEQMHAIARAQGPAAAKSWLRRELWRVLRDAPAQRLAHISHHRTHEARGDSLVTKISDDVRHALRALARAPRFAAVAVATLAIGIGANTAMFSVVNALLLKRLPFAEPDSLMLVHLLRADRNGGPGAYREMVWSYPRYRRFVEEQSAFESYALFSSRDFNLSGDEAPQRVRGEVITDRYASVLGATLFAGREFTYEEANSEGAPAVAMVGHALWTSRYGADPDIIGRSIQVNAVPYTVVGVLPPGFRGLNGDAQLWVPIAAMEPNQLAEPFSHSYTLVARRKPGVSAEAAVANTRLAGDLVGAELLDTDANGQAVPPNSATAASLSASRADTDVRRASLVLLGAVGFLLLIACVNLTNLLVARAIERRREVAIRTALGASRGRIGRQFLVESVLLAGAGALAGLALAPLLLAAAATLLPDSDTLFRTAMAPGVRRIAGAVGLTRVGAGMIGLDAATLLFTLGVTVATAVPVAVVPALQASSARPIEALKASGGGGPHGRLGLMGSTPIIAQIALALVLLAGAGLMVRSAVALHGTPIGIDPSDLLTVQLDLPAATYGGGPDAETGPLLYSQLLERVGALPGVEAVGMASFSAVGGAYNQTRATFLQPQRAAPRWSAFTGRRRTTFRPSAYQCSKAAASWTPIARVRRKSC